MQVQRILGSIGLGMGLTLVLLGALGTHAELVRADTLCVNPGGSGGCYASIQVAIDAADTGDTIRVAEGTYYEALLLPKSVTLEGGWNPTFTARDWDMYVTTIDAQRTGPVIWVNAAVSPTIEGLVLTGGDDTAHLGWGGGIKIYRAGGIELEGLTTIRHNVITNNIACTASSCQGHGGGIMVYRSTAIIDHNTIISNAARTGGDGGGQGGGVRIWTANATLIGNTIISNTAVFSTTGTWVGKGGGVCTQYAQSAVLEDNEVRGNVAAVKGEGYGGGVWANARLYGNRILSNTASIHDAGHGGGVYAYYVGVLDHNLIQGNLASQYADSDGGGIYGKYLQSARRNTIVHNVAVRGGGIYMEEYLGRQSLYENVIAFNQATGSTTPDGGGGIASAADWIEIVGNEFYGNSTASLGLGGGLLITLGERFLVQDNHFEDNFGGAGGGIAVYTATGSIIHNQITNNTSLIGGGMYLWGQASPVLDRNELISNTAAGFFGGAGGGLMINVADGTQVTLTNHMIAQNAAGADGYGGGLFCWRGDCVLINNTIADNNRGDHKEGVILGSTYGGTHTMLNNIIAGHSVGVEWHSGTATLDYNDYYDNDTNLSGVTWGANHRTDNPQFEDRPAGDYHLELTSPLIDKGTTVASINLDFEGDPRPLGGGLDIGADEAYQAESYVSELSGSDLNGDGSPASPFATVSKGLAETRTGGTVHVARGNYTERITITRDIQLLGGYHENDWSRDIAAYGSTLDAQAAGTVVIIQGEGVQATVEGFTITGGEASIFGTGGGLLIHDDAIGTIRFNTISGNHAQNGGGGLAIWGNENTASIVDSNRIFGNVADGVFVFPRAGERVERHPRQGPEPGGGLLIASGLAEVTNNWIYDNVSAEGGDGMALSGWQGSLLVYHNTVVDNGGSNGVGIELMGPSSQLVIHNNLIVGHHTAITAAAEVEATWDNNGFYDNTSSYAAGLTGGAHDQHGNPFFADRAGGDYHIGVGSVMVGAGTELGISSDIDGDARPMPAGTHPDLGADEVNQKRIYLPLVLKNYP